MGGFGSGRPSGSGRDKVEYSRSIDVNRLHRHGCLSAGWMGCWQWTQDDEKVASINLRAEHDQLHLSYRARIASGEWETIEEPVRVVHLLVGRVTVDASGIAVDLRNEGLGSVVRDMIAPRQEEVRA